MALNSNNTGDTGTIDVRGIVTLQDACEEAESKMGIRLDPRMIGNELKRSIALLMLMNHDMGIEGHNYGDKKRPVFAVVRQEESAMDIAVEELVFVS